MSGLRGNAIVGQSGGPTAVINATLCGVIRGVAELSDGRIGVLYGMRNGIEGLLDEKLVRLGDMSGRELGNLERTPGAALGSCRKKLPDIEGNETVYGRILDIFRKYDIRYFFYIGGNDSMDTVAKLSEYTKANGYEMCVIGIPKTIDNDLVGTDHTPGYGSAAKYIAVTMQEILRDCAAYTMKAVTVVEIMGRDAGWLTAASALGRRVSGYGPDLIYLPERNFSLDEFFEDLRMVTEDHPNAVVAVSEGIHFYDGTYVCECVGKGMGDDVFGHKALSGTGKALELEIKEQLGCKVRSVELNLPQRCAAHLASATDISESSAIGREAVKAALDGVTGEMMTIVRESAVPYAAGFSHAPVGEIANAVKRVFPEFINERGNNVTEECVDYLLPLIKGEVDIEYDRGIPVHFIF